MSFAHRLDFETVRLAVENPPLDVFALIIVLNQDLQPELLQQETFTAGEPLPEGIEAFTEAGQEKECLLKGPNIMCR